MKATNQLINKMFLVLMCSAILAGCSTASKVNEHKESNGQALAEAAFNYGQFDKAEAQYRQLLTIAPDNLEYQLMLARSEFRQDKKQSAIGRLYKITAADDPVAAQASIYLGRYLLKEARIDEAKEVYQSALAKANNDEIKAQLYNGAGVTLLELWPEKAKSALEQAMQLAPDNPFYRSNLALSYLHENNVTKAREVFTPLLSYQQLPQQVELNFALLLLAEGKIEQARALLSRYLPASEVERDLRILEKRINSHEHAQ